MDFYNCVCVFWPGECLITRATGEMSDREAERAGLVTTHVYAVLDIRHVKVKILHSATVAAKCHLYSVCASTTFSLIDRKPLFLRPKKCQVYIEHMLNLSCSSFFFCWLSLVEFSWRKEENNSREIYHCITNKSTLCNRQNSGVWVKVKLACLFFFLALNCPRISSYCFHRQGSWKSW